MKEFGEAKVQFVALDIETDEKYTLSLGKLVENADVTAITEIGQSLDTLIGGQITHAKVVESHLVSL
ncbi:MAG: hypothetical protein L0L39_02305 [Atopostipes suicloacalis]|nr:hypothetical protein [Atopostipes suicloacalis]MDN6730995.1 hypothetical protein [Atopostipes suicloacalis]